MPPSAMRWWTAPLPLSAPSLLVAGGLFTWNDLDTYGWNAFYTGIACMVFQLLPVLLLIVSSFMRQDAKKR